MPLYGLIGYPLTHSFSGKYFTEKFRQLGLSDHRYELFPISSIEQLPELLNTPGLAGLNVTIPYKQQVLAYLNDLSGIPPGLQACNCIRIHNGVIAGFNTDTAGFERSLMSKWQPVHDSALILGNGGATAAIAYVLQKKNIPYTIVSRSIKAGSDITYDKLTRADVSAHRLIINTTPLGMYPDTGTCPPIPYEAIGEGHYLFDLTYNPVKTLFLQKGEERGALIQNGYPMLEIQAEESWRIWSAGKG